MSGGHDWDPGELSEEVTRLGQELMDAALRDPRVQQILSTQYRPDMTKRLGKEALVSAVALFELIAFEKEEIEIEVAAKVAVKRLIRVTLGDDS